MSWKIKRTVFRDWVSIIQPDDDWSLFNLVQTIKQKAYGMPRRVFEVPKEEKPKPTLTQQEKSAPIQQDKPAPAQQEKPAGDRPAVDKPAVEKPAPEKTTTVTIPKEKTIEPSPTLENLAPTPNPAATTTPATMAIDPVVKVEERPVKSPERPPVKSPEKQPEKIVEEIVQEEVEKEAPTSLPQVIMVPLSDAAADSNLVKRKPENDSDRE